MGLLGAAQGALRMYLQARGVRSERVEVNGHSLHHYVVRGKGSRGAALLVHGLGGSANGYYRLLLTLSRRFSSVYAVDLPGHGFSPDPNGGALPVLELAEILEGYATQVVRVPAFLVGNSLGGAMSIKLALRHPSLVRALALVCPAGAKMSPAELEDVRRALLVRTTADAMALTRRLFHGLPLGWLLLSSELKKMYGTPAVRRVFESASPEDCILPEELGALAMPVLVLWGGSDRLLPAGGIHYFRAHLPPRARVELVEGFGHVPQVERPDRVTRRLVQFADEAGL